MRWSQGTGGRSARVLTVACLVIVSCQAVWVGRMVSASYSSQYKCGECSRQACGAEKWGEMCLMGLTARFACEEGSPANCAPHHDGEDCGIYMVAAWGYPCWWPTNGCGGLWCLPAVP